MKTKNNKTPARVKVNSCLFVLLAIVFGVMTFCGVNKLQTFGKNFRSVSDAPGLCYDEEAYKKSGSTVVVNAYPCLTQTDENGNAIPATSQNDYTMFLFDRTNLSGVTLTYELSTVITIIGGMFTLISLVGGIIYWNHNR